MKKKGRLKIFFGYCAGVGKTYAMLQEAQQKSVEGHDVVIGYIEPHDRKETTDLVYGLEQIPCQNISYKGKQLKEFDLDAALQRQPELLLVDELAHTNMPGSRHKKRYSDIKELLNAGIDVYTTINVQHLESLQDVVESITRIKVNERIPDSVFDDADDVKFVDIEIDELLQRLKQGKIYPQKRATQAMQHFFLRDNLVALRSIALRRCAERMNRFMALQKRPYVKEHILVCLSTSPTNAKVIRTAARMAQAFQADFTALYVESSEQNSLSEQAARQLQENLQLARHLQADIVSTYGDDIAYQISQYAKSSGISKVVIGRSFHRYGLFHKKTLIDTLTSQAPDLDVYIIPDQRSKVQQTPLHLQKLFYVSWQEICMTLLILLITTLTAGGSFLLIEDITISVLWFVLGACLIGVVTLSPICSILSACYTLVALNFFFIEPRFTFHMYSSHYLLIFFCLLIVSLLISSLTRKLKIEKIRASARAYAMDVLLDTSQNLQRCNTPDDIMNETCRQLYRIFKKTIIFYLVSNDTLLTPYVYDESGDDSGRQLYYTSAETAVAKWVLKNNKNAGVSTSTLPNAKALYLAIRKNEQIFAVVGIAMNPHEELPPYEKGLLKTILNEIALAFDTLGWR